MTEQEIFDTAVGKVLAQGGPSYEVVGDGLQCRYRGPSGRKCLVGHLIPDEAYRPHMEGYTAGLALAAALPHAAVVPLVEHEDFLLDLQRVHDQCALDRRNMRAATDIEFWRSFKERAADFARGRGLSTAVLDRVDALLAGVPQSELAA